MLVLVQMREGLGVLAFVCTFFVGGGNAVQEAWKILQYVHKKTA